jgi:hypothetical protein
VIDLIARANEISSQAKAIRDADRLQQVGESLVQRSILLREQLNGLLEVLAFLAAAAELKISDPVDPGALPEVRIALDASQRFRNDAEALVDDIRFRSLVRLVTQATTGLEREANVVWMAHVKKTLPSSLAGQEQILRADPRNDELVEPLLQCDEQLQALGTKMRPTAVELRTYQTALATRESLWNQISIEDEPEVVAFLRATGGAGASLSLVTDRVLGWLKKMDVLEDYLVRRTGD